MTWLLAALRSPLFGGGFALMLSGAVLALARKLPLRALAWLRRRLVVEVEVLDSDLLSRVGSYLGSQALGRQPVRARLLHSGGFLSDASVAPACVILEPGIGFHFTHFQGRRLMLELSIQAEAGEHRPRIERLTIRYFGRDPQLAKQLLMEATEFHARLLRGAAPVFTHRYEEWSQIDVPVGRPLESVILPDGIAEQLFGDMERFLGRRDWYADLGIPWRRGYLLEGPPGSGKSSAARALAAKLELPLYVPDLRDRALSDRGLALLFSRIPCRAVVLLEDGDCIIPNEEAADRGISLAGLLNVIDGPLAGAGRILVLTTNHAERLPEVLIRKGRVDVHVHLGPASADQAERLCRRIRPEHPDPAAFGLAGAGRSMAELQHELIGSER